MNETPANATWLLIGVLIVLILVVPHIESAAGSIFGNSSNQ